MHLRKTAPELLFNVWLPTGRVILRRCHAYNTTQGSNTLALGSVSYISSTWLSQVGCYICFRESYTIFIQNFLKRKQNKKFLLHVESTFFMSAKVTQRSFRLVLFKQKRTVKHHLLFLDGNIDLGMQLSGVPCRRSNNVAAHAATSELIWQLTAVLMAPPAGFPGKMTWLIQSRCYWPLVIAF